MNTNFEKIIENNNSQHGRILSKSTVEELEVLAKRGSKLAPLKQIMGNFILENTTILLATEEGAEKRTDTA